MEPDPLQQAWQASGTHPQLRIDMEQVLSDVRRDQQAFNAMIRLRDIREVGVGLVLIPIWIVMGRLLVLPWTWYLIIPGFVWVAGFFVVDRARQKRKRPDPGESLHLHVENSLAEVNHQIWLLRNVVWWYILPIAVPMVAFFAQSAFQLTLGDSWTALFFSAIVSLIVFALMVAIVSVAFGYIVWLNQEAVRAGLEPRRQELETLLRSLADERPAPHT